MRRTLNAPLYIVNGDMSAASVVGPWIYLPDLDNVTFIATWTASSGPTGTWGVDISDAPIAGNHAGMGPLGGASAVANDLTLPTSMTAGNPAGSAGDWSFQFDPVPTATWIRFKYTRSAGGDATGLQVQARGSASG